MLKPLTTSMEYIVPLYILYASTMQYALTQDEMYTAESILKAASVETSI